MQDLLDSLLQKPVPIEELDLKKVAAGAAVGLMLSVFPASADVRHNDKVEISWSEAATKYAADENIVAKVLAGEAGSAGEEGMKAVACVIQNRSGDAEDLVRKKYQFSSMVMPAMMEKNYKAVKAVADKLASEIGSLTDVTGGATNYVTKALYKKVLDDPKWAKTQKLDWVGKMVKTVEIGNHVFLKGK